MGRLSLHHVLPGDDLEENLVMLCGSGTSGHHGLIENEDFETCSLFGRYLVRHRPDVIAYVHRKLDTETRPDAGTAWLVRHLRLGS